MQNVWMLVWWCIVRRCLRAPFLHSCICACACRRHRCETRLLKQWAKLPAIASRAHLPLLRMSQLLLEASESMKITRHVVGQDSSNGRGGRGSRSGSNSAAAHAHARRIDDVKLFLLPWRKRLPNRADSMGAWTDCLSWRIQFFEVMRHKFRSLAPSEGDASLLHDAPWTVTTLARVARSKGLNVLANRTLAKLTMKQMERVDGFNKVREQLMIHYSGRRTRRGRLFGLDLVNSIISAEHMRSFRSDEQAELYRIKGEFLRSLSDNHSDRDLANKAYSRAAQASTTYSKGWLSWGNYLHSKLISAARQQQGKSKAKAHQQANSNNNSNNNNNNNNPMSPRMTGMSTAQATPNQQRARQILDCLLQAITYDTTRAHLSMVRVLSLLAAYVSFATRVCACLC